MNELTVIGELNYVFYRPFFPAEILKDVMEDENAFLYGVEHNGEAAGGAAIRFSEEEASLLYFRVDPEFRGRGVGAAFFFRLMEEAAGLGAATLSMRLSPDTDPKFLRLLSGYSARFDEGEECEFATSAEVLAGVTKLQGESKRSVALSELDPVALQELSRELKEEKLDLVPLPVVPEEYLGELSAVYMEKGKPTALLLLAQEEEGIKVRLLSSFSREPMAVMDMLFFSAGKLSKLPEDTLISMNIVEHRIRELLETIFKDIPEEGYEIRSIQDCIIDLGAFHEEYE